MRLGVSLRIATLALVAMSGCHGSGIAVELPQGGDDVVGAADAWDADQHDAGPAVIVDALPDVESPQPDIAVEVSVEVEAGGDATIEVDAGPSQDVVVEPDPPPPLLITELSAGDDWLEVHNPTAQAVELEGFMLTDDLDEPDPWAFPEVTLGPHGYVVVLASGKDISVPGQPLHADFKLSSGGEDLALLAPDGQVVHAWTPFPLQPAGASWGVAMEATSSTLIAAGHTARYRAPGGPSDPGPAWGEGPTGLGFHNGDAPPGELLGDSMADFSGVQGQGGWRWGYYDATADLDGVYQAEDFVPFPDDYWTGSIWDWPDGNPPFDQIGTEGLHPNGINNGAEHWVIRRFEVPITGAAHVEWHARKTNPAGSGVTATLFHEGEAVDEVSLAGDALEGVTREAVVDGLAPGDALDLALSPVGPDGSASDVSDGSATRMTVRRAADLGLLTGTDVSDAMAGESTSLLARLAFGSGDVPAAWNRLLLTMRYDDGFVAWINGELVAAAGAPANLEDTAAATATHGPAAAVVGEVFDATGALGALTGDDVLAVQGLNVAAGDASFLVLPELEAREVVIDAEATRYFDVPTPGADNLAAPAALGPVLDDPTRHADVGPGEPITIEATVAATSAPVASVTLTWRVMFGGEVEVAMAPTADAYAGVIPGDAAAPGEMVRWFITATDEDGLSVRTPAFADPLDSEQYYGTVVDDPSLSSGLPIYHWFAEDPEAAGTSTGTRCALFYSGELYDNVRFDIHGQSTQGFPKKSYNVDFNKDHRFLLQPGLKRLKDLNLLTNWADKTKLRNTLAYEIYRDAGGDHHLAHPVHLRLNGAFHSVSDFVEDGDDVWLERMGRDPDGALYKMYNSMNGVGGGQKKTRLDEGTDDLQALIDGMQLPPADKRLFLYDHVDLAAMANYVAAMTLTSNTDCCHKNYYAYRDTLGTGEWWYMPWDQDLTFGHNWTGDYFDDALYWDNPLFIGGNNTLLSALYAQPEFVEMVLRRLRTLMDEQVQPPGTPPGDLVLEARVLELALSIALDADADNAAWPTWGEVWTFSEAVALLISDYVVPRRDHLYGEVMLPDVEEPTVLLPGDGNVRYHIPTDDGLGASWRASDFDDAGWDQGNFGVGYENDPADYAALLESWAKPSEAHPDATAVLVRARFHVTDPSALDYLTLKVRYDDGFIAWIDGHEVARRNHPDPPSWDLTLPDQHDDFEAVSWEEIDISSALPDLVPGENVLAIRVVNVGPGSSDLLVAAELVDVPPDASGGPIPMAQGALTLEFDTAGLNGDGLEAWMSITNTGPTALDLSGHSLSGPVTYAFRPGTVLPVGGTLHVAANVPAFRARAESPTGGEGRLVQGPYTSGTPGAAPDVGPTPSD